MFHVNLVIFKGSKLVKCSEQLRVSCTNTNCSNTYVSVAFPRGSHSLKNKFALSYHAFHSVTCLHIIAFIS
jgi:hypothetical protein